MPDAAAIIIGNEILSGRTRDQNLPFIAERLAEHGIELVEARVVSDRIEAIAGAVRALAADRDYVFTTGGIGPTHDDVTTDAVAHAFGLQVVEDPEALARLTAYYGAAALTPARARMARVPAGAELLDNPVSAAPGFRVRNVYVLPGVPAIMQAMLEGLLPTLTGGAPILSRSVVVALPESRLADGLAAVQRRFPEVAIGSYPFVRGERLGTSVVVRGTDAGLLEQAAAAVAALGRELGAEVRTEP